MIHTLLARYIPEDKIERRITPLGVDAISPDYFLHLFAGYDSWYVVVEADYMFVTAVARDVENSFPIKVEGWCTLLDYQSKTGKKLLPPHVFKNESVNETDEDWEHYHGTVYRDDGMVYALMKVRPKPGITINDFGLSFYSNNQ